MKILRYSACTAILTVFAVLLGLNTAFAQTEIRGVVTDANKQLLQGVTVQVKGAGKATSTDQQGRFSLPVPANATLVFSFVGFATKEVPVENQSSLTVQLQQNADALGEVVVTALGIKKEKKGHS